MNYLDSRYDRFSTIDSFFVWLLAFILLWNAIQIPLFSLYATSAESARPLYQIFVLTTMSEGNYWTFVTSIYSHGGFIHFAKNLTLIAVSWVYLTQSESDTYSPYLLIGFVTLLPLLVNITVYVVFNNVISTQMAFLGASTFTYALVTFALLNERLTDSRIESIVVMFVLATLAGVEIATLVTGNITTSAVAHTASMGFGLLVTLAYHKI